MKPHEMAQWLYIGLFLLATVSDTDDESDDVDVEELVMVARLGAQAWTQDESKQTFGTSEEKAG